MDPQAPPLTTSQLWAVFWVVLEFLLDVSLLSLLTGLIYCRRYNYYHFTNNDDDDDDDDDDDNPRGTAAPPVSGAGWVLACLVEGVVCAVLYRAYGDNNDASADHNVFVVVVVKALLKPGVMKAWLMILLLLHCCMGYLHGEESSRSRPPAPGRKAYLQLVFCLGYAVEWKWRFVYQGRANAGS
ncbi:hypothetical protein F4778DRAFT_798268 [Xylariomycetidae sp. FL2044]|nr:hypothetical protein F4778DRAFT_798268 [Xylariomycetidae sp. FL2044]